jgi:radical SAM superfamily enzyme YgiQ (UPF0313 family)
MKIALLEIESNRRTCVNKDFMGGYGWAFNAGSSIPARIINTVKRAGERLPLMSFGYLAAIFSQGGHEVEYVRNNMPASDTVIMQPSMVDYKYEMSWARDLRKAGKRVGFIGSFASAMPDIFMDNCDFLIKGEPEEAAYRISAGLRPDGIIQSEFLEPLDKLPFPKWSIFPHKSFSYLPALREKPFFPILSSRGCAYRCNYCPYLVNYKWRQRSSEAVLDEIGYLIKRFGMRAMLFRDPIFTLDRDRAVAIAEGILKRGYRIKWACETRLDRVDEGLLRLMNSAGLRVMNVGIESVNEDVIKGATRKPVAMEHQERMLKFCDKIGVRVTVFYMFGMPDDTRKTIIDTIRYSKRLNTHVAQFFVFTPFPGTEFYDSIKDRINEREWERFDCYTPVFRHNNLTSAEIMRLKEHAFVSYYYRPAWAAKFIARTVRDLF